MGHRLALAVGPPGAHRRCRRWCGLRCWRLTVLAATGVQLGQTLAIPSPHAEPTPSTTGSPVAARDTNGARPPPRRAIPALKASGPPSGVVVGTPGRLRLPHRVVRPCGRPISRE
jgi:hypothetical protein